LICHPEQDAFAQRRACPERSRGNLGEPREVRVLCDTIIARLARFLAKLTHYRMYDEELRSAGGWMRAVVQRVTRAQVTVADEVTGKIDRGLLVLLGVSGKDTERDADYLAEKIAGLRIFGDKKGKMNLDVAAIGGALLVVSQFTLYGDVRCGKRPSFDSAAAPERARQLYEYFVGRIRAAGIPCQTGQFQEMMQVELVNDGPVTILLDSEKGF
jgi:D-tyrosyl-tRNA(Tyr) deacylase